MTEKNQCEIFCYDEPKVNRLKESINHEQIRNTTKILKALADETRFKIAYALSQEGELCVCDVSQIIGSSMATASHHLRLLKNLGLAKYRKDGRLVFYSLDDEHVIQLIQTAYEHALEGKAQEYK